MKIAAQAFCCFLMVLAGCSSKPGPPGIASQPQSSTAADGAVAVFTVAAGGATPITYVWSKNGVVIPDSNTATYLTAPVTTADSGTEFSVEVKNSYGSIQSAKATLKVVPAITADVLTYHNDNARSGQNASEVRLTPENLTQAHFHKIGIFPTDGIMLAQPLVVSNLDVGGAVRNVLYAATEHDSLFAYDADTGAQLWTTSLLPTGSGEVPSDSRLCTFIAPEIGVTATPVIDRSRGIIYVVASSMSVTTSGTVYYHRLHALDLATGAEMLGGPVTVPSTFAGITQTFYPSQTLERSALLLANGKIYTSWSSHCDYAPYSGWVIVFDASTLAVTQAFNDEPGTPDGRGAFWNSGSGPAADAAGNVYALSSNGLFDATQDVNGFPIFQDYGNSFIKLSPPSAGSSVLQVQDYFTMSNTADETASDQDLGSGGGMLLPDLTDNEGVVKHLMVGAGKDNHIYVLDRDSMGKFNASDNSQIWQELDTPFPSAQYGVFGSPAYFNNTVYYGAIADGISAFTVTDAKLSTSASQTSTRFPYPGATPSVSANGVQDGIVWAVENSATQGILHAYAASDLTNELYNSSQAGTRDTFGPGSKYVPPVIANGKVYVVTQINLTNNPSGLQEGVAAFGAF